MSETFQDWEQQIRERAPDQVLDYVIGQLRAAQRYPLLFEALLMRARHELGLPLIFSGTLESLPPEQRSAYEKAFIEAAREAGSRFLEDGDLAHAWPYLRAIGETTPVVAAIEKLEPEAARDQMDAVVEIGFQERVNPRKAFELVLANFGTCRAISFFEQYPDPKTRGAAAGLLVRTLHGEVVAGLKRAIEQQEGAAPSTTSIPELIAGHEWLFEGSNYYVDTSHLVSILRFSLDLDDPPILDLAWELTEYGRHLSSLFQFRVEPPFEDVYLDHAMYLNALRGRDADSAVAHFKRKIAGYDPSQVGTGPAQVFVALLVRLDRFQEAIEVSLEFLGEADPNQILCPGILELCQMAGDFDRMAQLSRSRNDVLGLAAGLLQRRS